MLGAHVSIFHLIHQYGYIALYAALSFGIVGLPVPDETLMVFVGSLTSYSMSFTMALLVSFSGAMTGMIINYTLGRKVGKPFLLRYGKWIHLTTKRLEKAETWFQKYGVWTVIFGYFIPGFRHFTCYLAGVSVVPFWKYILYAASGAIVWCMTFLSIGHFIGANFDYFSLMWKEHRMAGIVFLASILSLILYVVVRFRKRVTN